MLYKIDVSYNLWDADSLRDPLSIFSLNVRGYELFA